MGKRDNYASKKRKLYCDDDPASNPNGRCTDPEIKRGKDRCHDGDPVKGHTAKELEKHRPEIDGYHKLINSGDEGNVVEQKNQPRPPYKIYDQVIDENS